MKDQDEHIKRLIRDALGDAFKLQIAHLYKIWLSNPTDMKAARERASTGLRSAMEAYSIAIDALESWET